ncbi:MAG: DUF4381 family protein [Gammaproteobacteria bacterium]
MPEQVHAPWVDIVTLPAPTQTPGMTAVLLTLVAGVALVWLARYLWQRPRVVARRQLQQLHRQTVDSRRQLFILRRILQQGLQVNHLQELTLDTARQHDWQRFCDALLHGCYRAAPPDPAEVQRLTTEARRWMKRL